MSQNARESLSALMDNEGDDLELRRVLKSLEDDADAAEAWRRYHLMRSLLRRDHDIDVSTDLSAGILARIEEEPIPVPARYTAAPRRALPLARSAGVAAAVTLMVITGVQFYHGSGVGGGQPEVAESGSDTPATVAPAAERRSFSLPATYGQAAQVGLPLFAPRGAGTDSASSFLTSAGNDIDTSLFGSPSPRQSLSIDREQAQLLQSYLDRHAEGAAYRSGDDWMPLLRASGSETLGPR